MTSVKYSHLDFERNPYLAVEDISSFLAQGQLNLFLGAGISADFGLPDWITLLGRIIGRETDVALLAELKSKSPVDLAQFMDDYDDGTSSFSERVQAALYAGVSPNLLDLLRSSPLLLAVMALLTGTARGRVEGVYTYNYDDLLEQYLTLLGIRFCSRTEPYDYCDRSDIEINHIHGYVPQHWDRMSALPPIILSERSYRGRRTSLDQGWPATVRTSLYRRCGLFLGLSGDDTSILDVLGLARNNMGDRDEYRGYWVLTPGAFAKNKGSIVDVGMCPIPLEKEKLPGFLLQVCEAALT